MKLRTLAQATGVSATSIKYYIHVGILNPGKKRNATTADYTQAHVVRLALITCLRKELGTPISSIAELTDAIEDESLENIELMGICQRLALEAGNALYAEAAPDHTPHVESSPDHTPHTEAEAPTAIQTFEDEIREVLKELDWPDVSPTAVSSVAQVLTDLSAAGYSVGAETVLLHARALAEIASRNTTPITDELSRDEICVEVIRGITLHNRLLVATSALTHASLSAMPRRSSGEQSQATKSV